MKRLDTALTALRHPWTSFYKTNLSPESSCAPQPAVPAAAQGHANCAGITRATPQTPECDALMAAQPNPDVTHIPFDLGVIAGQDFIYFDADAVLLYNRPDGDEIGVFPAGRSSCVNVLQISGDWAEIRPNRWVSLANAYFATPSTLTGAHQSHRHAVRLGHVR